MSHLSAESVEELAEKLRKTQVGMGNYASVLNDAFVGIRELADRVVDLTKRVETLEKGVVPQATKMGD